MRPAKLGPLLTENPGGYLFDQQLIYLSEGGLTVTETDILRLAQLVRIGLEPVEARRLTAEMDVILEHVNRLQLVDTSGVGDSADHASSVMRDDTITPSLTVEEVLANAPEKHEMFFVVPAVLGEEPSGR